MDETEELEQIEEEVSAMTEAELQEYNDELVDEVKKFIEKNSERNHDQVERIKADREFAPTAARTASRRPSPSSRTPSRRW